jgi:uncharacterized membrane protein YoaK (UPF0700 family)
MLLSAAGGALDAFTRLAHGGVFANAQTGNVVLLGVYAALGQWTEALRHIPPIIAFVLGVFVAHRLSRHASQGDEHRAALFSLVIEIALLVVVMILPSDFSGITVTLGISFVAALQTSSFAKVEGRSYSSVMTTGNLRKAAGALFAGIAVPRDRAALREAGVFATICLTFGLGAGLGAFSTARLGNGALAVPGALLLLALVRCSRREQASGGGD